ncbi:hypothetical protein M979_4419 [Buttiauxella noackiae ATCC 51607]|uniref:Uncharacterized protein n=1 Tax=Buttiauxella noackiae ATCC 51607 TaxID=1354255 RepID=A0A1B7HG85_9ENTR|nr:hypothetical protein M979_4419 [Buttiauxella noackiae ATCC 51607]
MNLSLIMNYMALLKNLTFDRNQDLTTTFQCLLAVFYGKT